MYHPKMVQFKTRLDSMFDEVDRYIEDKYGDLYPLHPNRPAQGETANPQADGLFNIGADFTPGFGSRYGRGYIVDIAMVTLSGVDDEARRVITDEVVGKLRELLPRYFPERILEIYAEGDHFKICGDFSLGYV
jgi:hypothetical protein